MTIDTFNDQRRGARFVVSALGVQADASFDAMRRNATGSYDPLDQAWDAVWESAAHLTERGYSIEAAVPFRSIQFPAGGARSWGFFFSRHWPRSSAVEVRSVRLDRALTCELCQAAKFEGLSRVEAQRLVYRALDDEMGGEIHALAMTTLAPAQWHDATD